MISLPGRHFTRSLSTQLFGVETDLGRKSIREDSEDIGLLEARRETEMKDFY